MMPRFGMGFGKDHPKQVESGRPALTNQGTRRQRVVNDWFENGPEQRPEWLLPKYRTSEKDHLEEQGDWKLVWRPRSRMTSPTRPTRKILMTLKDDEERERLKAQLKEELLRQYEESERSMDTMKRSNQSAQSAEKEKYLPDIRVGSARTTHTACTSRTASSVCTLKSTQGKVSDVSHVDQDRASIRSQSSLRSKSVLSNSSASTIQNREELLNRIKGLEDALIAEKKMREKIQTVLKQESQSLFQ